MPKYKKLPVLIEAREFTGENFHEFLLWADEYEVPMQGDETSLTVETLEGPMKANIGDFIIRGVANEFYPCKPEIFAASYEPAEDFTEQKAANTDETPVAATLTEDHAPSEQAAA